jgi:hypothetical protein
MLAGPSGDDLFEQEDLFGADTGGEKGGSKR